MDAPVSRAAASDICLALGATLPPEHRLLTALSLLFTLVSLTTIMPTVVAKELRNTCEEIQILRGVQDTTALAGKVFCYPISSFAFQGKIAHYKVSLASGSPLPKWLDYNPNTNTLQGVPMLEDSGDYHLNVVAYGESCGLDIPTADVNFTLHIQDNVSLHEKEVGANENTMHVTTCSGGLCTKDVSVTFAEIIIHHTASCLTSQERLYLICTMAEYLHLEPSVLTLASFEGAVNKYLWNLTVLAEDVRYISTMKTHFVGLYWPVGLGVFAMLYELVQVLQHNVESNNLSQLLGYKIAGWRILKKEGNEKKHPRKRHRRQLMATPRPALRPSKTEALPILPGTLLHTKPVVRPSENISPLPEATRTALPTYTDIFLHSVTNQRDLGILEMQTFLNVQTKTPAYTIFQDFSSAFPELSPSLVIASREWGDEMASRTPPIAEQLHLQAPQKDMYSSPKELEPKHQVTLFDLGLFVPTSKTQLSKPVHSIIDTYGSPVVTPSERMSLEHFSRETETSLDYSGPYAQLTPSGLLSGDIISTTKLLVPSMLTLMNQTASLWFKFSSVVVNLLLSSSSYWNQDLFSNYKHASELYVTVPQTDKPLFTEENNSSHITIQKEGVSRNMDFNVIGIASTFDSAASSSAFSTKLGLPPDRSPTIQLYYTDSMPALALDSIQEFSMSLSAHFLEYGILSRTSNIPGRFPSLPLSMSVDLRVSSGLGNILPVEVSSDRRQVSPELYMISENASESFMAVSEMYGLLFTKDKISTFTATHTGTPLWSKQPELVYMTASTATVLSSGFLSEDSLSRGVSFSSEWHSYDTQLSWPEFGGTPKLCLSTNEFVSHDSSVARTPVACPDSLQWDMSDLSLDSSFGTNTNFQITRTFTSELMELSTITSNEKTPVQTGFYATSFHHRPQGQTNTSPRIVNAIKWITATIGHEFSFSVPPDTFYDQEDGNTTQLTLGISPIDGSPTGLESWLQFNSCYQTMYGYPLHHDFQYSPQEFLLLATDSGGLKTSNILTIELLRPTIIPCHIYTIRTKNSYYSFLRNRGKISLFFEKLSNYLNVGSPGNMTLLNLRPGSTVITWYNHSFCTRTSRCARDEIQRVLIKLRVPDGNVNPSFVEAMLPDYKIDQIEDVAYDGICSSTAKPLNESLTSNRTLAGFEDRHSWIRNILSALLISVCTTVMVTLIITFYYCKHHKKVSGPQSASSHTNPCFSHVDLQMEVLKSRKPPILEQEVPPTAHLWLPVPTPSQPEYSRSNRSLLASKLPPPPKYRLPPSYGMEDSSQTCHLHSHRSSYPKATLH